MRDCVSGHAVGRFYEHGTAHLPMYFTVIARVRGWESSSPQTIQMLCQQGQDPVVTLTPGAAAVKEAEPAQDLSH